MIERIPHVLRVNFQKCPLADRAQPQRLGGVVLGGAYARSGRGRVSAFVCGCGCGGADATVEEPAERREARDYDGWAEVTFISVKRIG